MEIPESVKVKVLAVVLSRGGRRGVALERLAGLYEEQVHQALDVRVWGFSFLMEFIQAMPQLVRLKFDRREESWKVYAILNRNPYLPKHLRHTTPEVIVFPGKSLQQETEEDLAAVETSSVCSTEGDPEPVDVSHLTLLPDPRGLYSICFSRHRKPNDWMDLREMFSMVGPVAEIHQTGKMVFVRYTSGEMVRLAMKMFPSLGLTVARVNIEATPQPPSLTPQTADPLGVEVLIQNLHNHYTVTEVHLQELFQGFSLLHVDVHYDSSLGTQCAEARVASASEAHRLVSRFNGHNFLGRNLVVCLKHPDKAPGSQKENLPTQSQTFPSPGPPPWKPSPPCQEKDVPGLEPHSGIFSSVPNRDEDIYIESAHLRPFSECRVMEGVEGNVCREKPKFGRVLRENIPPLTAKDHGDLKKAGQRRASDCETSSRREESVENGGLALSFGRLLFNYGEELSRLELLERESSHQRETPATEKSPGSCLKNTHPQRRTSERDLELEDVKSARPNSFQASEAVSGPIPQREGRSQKSDQRRLDHGEEEPSPLRGGECVHNSLPGLSLHTERNESNPCPQNTAFREDNSRLKSSQRSNESSPCLQNTAFREDNSQLKSSQRSNESSPCLQNTAFREDNSQLKSSQRSNESNPCPQNTVFRKDNSRLKSSHRNTESNPSPQNTVSVDTQKLSQREKSSFRADDNDDANSQVKHTRENPQGKTRRRERTVRSNKTDPSPRDKPNPHPQTAAFVDDDNDAKLSHGRERTVRSKKTETGREKKPRDQDKVSQGARPLGREEEEGGGKGRGEFQGCLLSGPQLSALEVRVMETGVEVPAIFVANFHKSTTEKQLSRWFAAYNPSSVCLVRCAKTGLMKAHIELSDLAMVQRAVCEMNQRRIHDLKVKVDVPFFLPRLRAEVLGTNPANRKLMKDPKLSPFIGYQKGKMDERTAPEASVRKNKTTEKQAKQTSESAAGGQGGLEELAERRAAVTQRLNAADLVLRSGSEVEVKVTHVISDSLLMGQAGWPGVQQKLEQISEEITRVAEVLSPPPTQARQDLQGPCLARWKKDYRWHRAWVFSGHGPTRTVEVYLLDEGVRVSVAWSCVRHHDDPAVWNLPPLALPFTLTEPIVKLKSRLHSRITLTVTSTDKSGVVTAKPVSLVSNWKEMMNIDTILC